MASPFTSRVAACVASDQYTTLARTNSGSFDDPPGGRRRLPRATGLSPRRSPLVRVQPGFLGPRVKGTER